MDIGPGCRDFLFRQIGQKLSARHPYRRRHGDQFGAVVLTHDTPRGVHATRGSAKECQIGAHSIIMPGVRVGDNCVVAAASVVMKDVPSNCLVAATPRASWKRAFKTGRWGIIDRTVRPDFGQPRPYPATAPEKAAS